MLERTSVCLEQGRSFQMICSEVSFRHLFRVRGLGLGLGLGVGVGSGLGLGFRLGLGLGLG